jgi:hypothetical protein
MLKSILVAWDGSKRATVPVLVVHDGDEALPADAIVQKTWP